MSKTVDFANIDWTMIPKDDKCKIHISWNNSTGYYLWFTTLDDEYISCEPPEQLKKAIVEAIMNSHIED